MAYTDSKIQAIEPGIDSSAYTISNIAAATGTAVCRVNQSCDLFSVGAMIVVAPTAQSSLVVTRNLAPGVTASATNVATVTIPNLTAIGKIVYINGVNPQTAANLLPVHLNAGDELQFTMTGTTITWRPWFEAYPRPEVKGNNSDFLLSA